jgi:RNA polymerase sigma-70 factor (ECF subfamily)
VSTDDPDESVVTDEAWLVIAARADRDAFRPLYERYADQVYRYCYLRLGSREAAEDATSEVFVKAITGLHGYQSGIFAGWLFRIAHNVVIDAYRRERHRRHLPLSAAMLVDDPGASPDELAIAGSDLDRLREALRTLPSDQRQTIELQLADSQCCSPPAPPGTDRPEARHGN